MSELDTIGTKDGSFELIIVGGEREGFDDYRVGAVHLKHIDDEWLGVTEKMKGEGTRVVFGESSKIRVTMRVELSDESLS